MWGLNDILTHSIAYGMGEEEEKAKAEREKKASNNWHTGTPTEEGWYLIKYKCILDGKYKGNLSFRAVKRYKDELDGFIYEDGGINADDIWKPIEWQKIEEKDNG